MTITPAGREVIFSTMFNFRDLGGLPTMDGGQVRRGVLFRSDDLGRLTLEDKETFAALGIRRVIDLRRDFEVEELGRVPSWTGAEWHHHHLEHDLWDHSTYSPEVGVARWLADRYNDLLEQGAADIARVIRLLSEHDDGPTVVHCVAGKDRTGTVTALTLSLLDVADDEIAADYALTELSEDRFLEWFKTVEPEKAALPMPDFYTQTPAMAMQLTLAELRERHGSVRDYVARHGVTQAHIDSLKAGLVE